MTLRHSRTFIIILGALILAACAPQGGVNRRQSLPASTGYYDTESGTDYVHGGDTRVDQALKEEPKTETETETEAVTAPPIQGTPAPAPQAPEEQKPLREQLKEFEISRYDEGSQSPSRFGAQRFRVKFFRKNQRSIEFTGTFSGAKPRLMVAATSGEYTLTGHIDDQAQQSKGEFILSKGADTARVFYWAYRASLKVREDRTRDVVSGSQFEQQLRNLRTNTFGWVHNWTVVRGRAFYIVDIVRVLQPGQTVTADDALFSFKGESLRTGDQVHRADVVGGQTSATDVELIGNSEEGAGRTFSVKLPGETGSAELNEVMIDIDLDEGQSPGITPDPPPSDNGVVIPDNPPVPEPKPVQPGDDVETDDGGGSTQEPVTFNNAYLSVDMTQPRSSKMIRDLNRNKNIDGVKAFIREYKGGGRAGLSNFFKYANPFRKIMEKAGATFDVSPAYAYLTVVESAYFTGGKYVIERPKRRDGTLISSALGPFQILEGTAKGSTLGMNVTDLWKNDPTYDDDKHDERRFFVPSACGAARYMRYLVKLFDDSDTTLSILGYFQGEGGAAAAIYCAFDSSIADREACMKKINTTFTGGDYGRFLRLAKNYNYTYAEMAKRSAGLTKGMRDYVNKKLAVYFIASDMKAHGFEISPDAPRSLPGNGTVMPTRKLNDQTCEAAIKPIL